MVENHWELGYEVEHPSDGVNGDACRPLTGKKRKRHLKEWTETLIMRLENIKGLFLSSFPCSLAVGSWAMLMGAGVPTGAMGVAVAYFLEGNKRNTSERAGEGRQREKWELVVLQLLRSWLRLKWGSFGPG